MFIERHPQRIGAGAILVDPAETFPYLYRARTVGQHYWSCPRCGHVQQTALRANTYLVQCSTCRRAWALGSVLNSIQAYARRGVPEDAIIPRRIDPLPEGLIGVWSGTGNDTAPYIHRIG